MNKSVSALWKIKVKIRLKYHNGLTIICTFLSIQKNMWRCGTLILWNLFEAKWFKCNFGRNKRNIQNIHLTSDIFNQTLQYLQRRYITNGSTNERFMRLRLRNNDDTTSIQRVLLGLTNNSCDIIKAIIMIIYRYRNNLFHGEKAIASLPMQKDNFINANKFLIACLEATK